MAWIEPPDPCNRAVFLEFCDMRRARGTASADIRREIAHWSGWLDADGFLGRAPAPGRRLARLGAAERVVGAAAAAPGLLGLVVEPLGVALTVRGVGAVIVGDLVRRTGDAILSRTTAAPDLVRPRRSALFASPRRARRVRVTPPPAPIPSPCASPRNRPGSAAARAS